MFHYFFRPATLRPVPPSCIWTRWEGLLFRPAPPPPPLLQSPQTERYQACNSTPSSSFMHLDQMGGAAVQACSASSSSPMHCASPESHRRCVFTSHPQPCVLPLPVCIPWDLQRISSEPKEAQSNTVNQEQPSEPKLYQETSPFLISVAVY